MPGFRYLSTFNGSATSMLDGIVDLDLRVTPQGTMLYATTTAGGGVTALKVTNGGLETVSQVIHRGNADVGVEPELTIIGNTAIVSGLAGNTLPGYSLTTPKLQTGDHVEVGGATGSITHVASAEIDGTTFVFASGRSDNGISVYRWAGDGMQAVGKPTGSAGDALTVGDIGDLTVVETTRGTYLAATNLGSDRVTLWSVSPSGTLKETASIGAEDGLGMADPNLLATATVGGITYVLVGSTGSSSISVLEVQANGGLRATDHVIDDLGTRFDAISALTTVTSGDRTYVLAGGGDDGISLLTLLPDGTLLHLATIEDDATRALGGVQSILALLQNGTITVFATSSREGGIARLEIDPDTGATLIGGKGADHLVGGAKADLLAGGAGHDILSGGQGDDILMDGAGGDRLTGGAGADIFVMAADGERDVITDFDPANDRLDLSRWPMMRDKGQLTFSETSFGAIVQFGSETLEIRTANGKPLSWGQLGDVTDKMSHMPMPSTTGTAGADKLQGGSGNNTLTGHDGEDTLDGGTGGDMLNGGNGSDWATYDRARDGVSASLTAPQKNTGEAKGDTYVSIENLRGSSHDDRLEGNLAANIIMGGDGADLLFGLSGNDTLYGDSGNDRIDGGAGADLIYGGEGMDTVDYRQTRNGVTVDLIHSWRNTDIATGDRYVSIENVAGGRGNDKISGNFLNNKIGGGAGNDILSGRSGNDTLKGAAGHDTLFGGAGSDFMDGGKGRDTVSYADIPTGLFLDLMKQSLNAGAAAGDRIVKVENIIGSSGHDTIHANRSANRLEGGGGNDALSGRFGKDSLFGGTGNDTLAGGQGADLLDGGAGRDTAHYGDAGGSLRIDLGNPSTSTGFAKGDRFISIEDVIGSNFSDVILGNALDNVLSGMNGNDALRGLGGRDTLFGGNGNDTLFGGQSNDRLDGGAGNDHLYGDQGADTLLGGQGTDTVDYSLMSARVTVDLSVSARNAGAAAGDLIREVENVTGSVYSDDLRGDHNANRLEGFRGNDILQGRGGNDTLDGGAGNDVMTGGVGADTFVFNSGKDRITDFQLGVDTLQVARGLTDMTAARLIDSAHVAGGATIIDFGGGHTLRIDGVTDPRLLLDDFIFL